MASDLIVPVVEVRNVRIHPGADMLSLCDVLGYQMVNGLVEDPKGDIERCFIAHVRDERGRRIPANGDYEHLPEEIQLQADVVEGIRYSFRYKDGDKAVYFPADTVLSDALAEEFEVAHLLKDGNRVGRARLRGEPSFGLVVGLPDGVDWEVGQNVAEHYDVKKWSPPADKVSAPDAAEYDSEIDPLFVKYTDIQNGLLLYDKFEEGEEVVATEKIHGKNCRVGLVNGRMECGSRTYRKQEPEGDLENDLFWNVFTLPGVKLLLRSVEETGAKVVILYGEIYGQGVQSLHYGCNKKKGFRAFDLYVDGVFMDHMPFLHLCDKHGVEVAPVVYRGPFDLTKIKEISGGKSDLPGAKNIREGVVVRPAKERRDPALGRVVLKFISPEYDLSKHKKKDTTDL
jgi:RNA ligase (TIGR02306 family)